MRTYSGNKNNLKNTILKINAEYEVEILKFTIFNKK